MRCRALIRSVRARSGGLRVLYVAYYLRSSVCHSIVRRCFCTVSVSTRLVLKVLRSFEVASCNLRNIFGGLAGCFTRFCFYHMANRNTSYLEVSGFIDGSKDQVRVVYLNAFQARTTRDATSTSG